MSQNIKTEQIQDIQEENEVEREVKEVHEKQNDAKVNEGTEEVYSVTRKEMDDMQVAFRNKIRVQKEPIEELTKILDLLKMVKNNKFEIFNERDACAYFFKDFIGNFTTTITKLIKLKIEKEEFLDLVKQVPGLLASILAQNIGNIELINSMRCIFDPKSRLYQHHCLAEANAILIANQGQSMAAEERDWRQALTEGSKLDAIKIDPEQKVSNWSRCTVKSRIEDAISVTFENDSYHCDRGMSIYSYDIAQLGSKTVDDYKWRESIQVGDLIDCYDSTQYWYASTVIGREVRLFKGDQIEMAHIALRVMHPDGDQSDEKGNKFYGWSDSFDEWMPLHSARLAKYQSHTKDTFQNQTQENQNKALEASTTSTQGNKDKTDVEDGMDYLVSNIDGQEIFAVHRKEGRSSLHIDFLNQFGQQGGFDNILQRIKQQLKEPTELLLISQYIDCLEKCSPIFHRQFVDKYFEALEQALIESILSATELQLRKTKKEVFDQMIEQLYKTLLPRIKTKDIHTINADRQFTQLEIGKLFLKQKFLEKRIDGLKLISDVGAYCLRVIRCSSINLNDLQAIQQVQKLEFVKSLTEKIAFEDSILKEVYLKENTHSQLVQRSEQIIRVLMAQELLTNNSRELIWDVSEMNDADLQVALQKVLIGGACDMKIQDRQFFLNKVEQMNSSDIIDRHIQLVREICTTIKEKDENSNKIIYQSLQLLWKTTMESGSSIDLVNVNRASFGFSAIIEKQSISIKLEFIEKLVENMKNNKLGSLSVKILSNILRTSNQQISGHPEIESLSDLVDYLETNHNLLEITFQNFQDYMKKVGEEIRSDRVNLKDDLQKKVFTDSFIHSDQIKDRLDFIKFYTHCSHKVKLRSNHLNILWDDLIVKSLVSNDDTHMYLWLREVCDEISQKHQSKDNSLPSIISTEDLIQFYHDRMATEKTEGDEYKFLGIQGFHCIQSFFVLINEIQGKLIRVGEDFGIYKSSKQPQEAQANSSIVAGETSDVKTATGLAKKFTGYNSNTGAQYSSYSFNTTDQATETQTETQQNYHNYVNMIGPLPKTAKGSDSPPKEEDPDELEIMILGQPNELIGSQVIWRVATECTSKAVIDAAAKLLIQMHYDIKPELEDLVTGFDQMFIDKCFSIMYSQLPIIQGRTEQEKKAIQDNISKLTQYATTIQKLRAFPVQDRRIMRSIFLLRQMIRVSEKNGTYDLRPHSSLSKGITLGNIQIQNSYCHGNGHRGRFEISIDSHATMWDLKKRIGEEITKRTVDEGATYGYYPYEGQTDSLQAAHPAGIRVFQMSTSQDLKDSVNGTILKELKFKTNETLGVFKKSDFSQRRAYIVEDNKETGLPQLTFKANLVLQEIFDRFSVEQEGGIFGMNKQQAMEFTKIAAQLDLVETQVNKFMEDYDPTNAGYITVENFKVFFVDACVNGKDYTVRQNLKHLGYSHSLIKSVDDRDPENYLQIRKSKEQMPRYMIAKNEKYFDFLLSLLGIQQDLSMRIIEMIGMLATNPTLYDTVYKLDSEESETKFSWSKVFDSNNVHKMLYSLEIIEAILLKDQGDLTTHKWIKQFLDLGGFQQLQDQLQIALTLMTSNCSNEQKRYVDQLLKLIKIFVMASKVELDQQSDSVEKSEKKDVKTQEYIEEDKNYSTPKKQIKSIANDGVSMFDITQEGLFGDAPKEDNKKVDEVNKPEVKDEDKDDDPYAYLRRILAIDGLGKQIVEVIDKNRLQEQAIQSVSLFLCIEEIKADDRDIIESAMNLWTTLISDTNEGQSNFQIDSEFLGQGLHKCKNLKIRESFRISFNQVCKANVGKQIQLLKVLLPDLQKVEDIGKNTREFFGLYSDMISQILKSRSDDTSSEIDQIITEIFVESITLLKQHKSNETRASIINDITLQGLLDNIRIILTEVKEIKELKLILIQILLEKQLLEELFYNCLFYQQGKSEMFNKLDTLVDGRASNKCVTEVTVKAGFKVLSAYLKLIEPLETADFLESYIVPLIQDVERPKKWRHLPSSKSRVEKHVGITNLGCICYMISMLQQLFMVPQFRYQLLKAVDTTPEAIIEYKGDKIDDNMLRQLQMLFGFLELSDRHAYDPKALVFSIKDYDGTPTKTGEQKDSQEFLNIFFDKLENQLKPTSQKDLLKDVFAGHHCSQLVCQSCGKVKNKMELFYMLSLQVQGCTGIYDSLNKMVKGQTIEEYSCEGCNKKVNVTQRAILADMPNVLIVHLKRIVFCFDTLQNDKVNSRFDFPNILDLKDYSFKNVMKDTLNENMDKNEEMGIEGIKELKELHDDEYIYRLVGVNIHTGAADHGHYYSLINIKRGADEPIGEDHEAQWRKVETDPWKEFNDAEVKEFNFGANLIRESFGGAEEQSNKTSDSMTDEQLNKFLSSGTSSYGKSAYMLIYERKSKKNLKEYKPNSEKDDVGTEVQFREVEKFVPEWIQNSVNTDNKSFLVDSQLFNQYFFNLIKDALHIVGGDHVMSSHRYGHKYMPHFTRLKTLSLEIGGKVCYDMLAYYDKNAQLSGIASSLVSIMTFTDSKYSVQDNLPSIVGEYTKKYLLNDSCQHLFKIMFNCSDSYSQNQIGNLTSKTLIRLFKLYADCSPESKESSDAVKSVHNILDQFMGQQLIILHDKECLKNWTKLKFFFQMIQDITMSCVTSAQFMLEKQDVIADLIDFILGNKSPRVIDQIEKRTAMGGSVNPPFQPLFTLISFLVRMTHTSVMDLSVRLPTHIDLKFESPHESWKTYFLSDEAWTMLTKTEFLEKIIFDSKYDENKEFAAALAHLCYKNLEFTRKISKKLLKSISYSNNDQVQRHLNVVRELLTIKDQYQVHRLEYLLGFGFLMHVKIDGDQIIQYGAPLMQMIKEQDQFLLSSGLDTRQHDDALLSLLWRYKGRMESFTLTCLQFLAELVLTDDVIYEYFQNLPTPSYRVGRYLDWVEPYLYQQIEDSKKYAGTGTEDKLKVLHELISKFENIRNKNNVIVISETVLGAEKAENDGSQIYQDQNAEIKNNQKLHQYVILKALDEKEVSRQDFDDKVELSVTQVRCEYALSFPTGDKNLSVNMTLNMPKTNEEQIQQSSISNSFKNKLASSSEPQDLAEAESSAFICEDLVYRITATNKHTATLKLKINFHPKCEENDIDLIWPRGGVKDYIKPGTTSHILAIQRKNPFNDKEDHQSEIGKLDISLRWKEYFETDFTMSNYASTSDKPVGDGIEVKNANSSNEPLSDNHPLRRKGIRIENACGSVLHIIPTDTDSQGTVGKGYGVDDQGNVYGSNVGTGTPDAGAFVSADISDLTAASAGEKACPICTVFNDSYATTCEVCGTAF